MAETGFRFSRGIYQIIEGEKVTAPSLTLDNDVYIDYSAVNEKYAGKIPRDYGFGLTFTYEGQQIYGEGLSRSAAKENAIQRILYNEAPNIPVYLYAGNTVIGTFYILGEGYTIDAEEYTAESSGYRCTLTVSGTSKRIVSDRTSPTMKYYAASAETIRIEHKSGNISIDASDVLTMWLNYDLSGVGTYKLYGRYASQPIGDRDYTDFHAISVTAKWFSGNDMNNPPVETGRAYIQWDTLPAVFADKSPLSSDIYLYVLGHKSDYYGACDVYVYPLTTKLNIPGGVCRGIIAYNSVRWRDSVEQEEAKWLTLNVSHYTRNDVINNGIAFAYNGLNNYAIYTPNATESIRPYILLTYSTGNPVVRPSGPFGYTDRTRPTVFRWEVGWENFPYADDIIQLSAVLSVKNGPDGEVTTYNIPDSQNFYTLPANTLPLSSELMWMVEATTNSDVVTTGWQTFSTTDAVPTTTAISPSGAFVDGSETNRFRWQHNTSTGTAQSAYQIQAYAGGTWQTVVTASAPEQYADIPPHTLPSGNIRWRVRTYNADGIPGEWSNELNIMVVDRPQTPAVTVTDSSPRASIRWESLGQQAYRVRAGDYDSGIIYGTEKNFTFPDYLPDGLTLITVAVTNIYGMWSDPGEAYITIENPAPQDAPQLTATASESAVVTWTPVEGADVYQILRDGVRIATTEGQPTGSTQRERFPGYEIGRYSYQNNTITEVSSNQGIRVALELPAGSELSIDTAEVRLYYGRFLDEGGIENGNISTTTRTYITPDTATYYLLISRIPVAEITDEEIDSIAAHVHIMVPVPLLSYEDRLSVGTSTYRVRAVLGSVYADSNDAAVTVTPTAPIISTLDGDWLDLSNSLQSLPEVSTSLSVGVSLLTTNERPLPIPEASKRRSRTLTLAPAFSDRAAAARFEALIGDLVVYKDQHGNNIVGVMNSMTKAQNVFFTSFRATITEVDPAVYEKS